MFQLLDLFLRSTCGSSWSTVVWHFHLNALPPRFFFFFFFMAVGKRFFSSLSSVLNMFPPDLPQFFTFYPLSLSIKKLQWPHLGRRWKLPDNHLFLGVPLLTSKLIDNPLWKIIEYKDILHLRKIKIAISHPAFMVCLIPSLKMTISVNLWKYQFFWTKRSTYLSLDPTVRLCPRKVWGT